MIDQECIEDMRQQSLPPYLDKTMSDMTSDIMEEDAHDLLMSSDGEPSVIRPPRPHIAARFYPPNCARRKSSTTSSRRNSISSLHSSRSNRSSTGGAQSAHVAQHLRRTSIIESRKARLADRAAHAEKVRLRAALAKAAPRMSTAREDRAIAAQQARERYLAQVAANCAEEVRRAKRVAEDMKEKKAAEHLKLKCDMEQKLADVERRRLMYQQNPRHARISALATVEEKKAITTFWKPRNQDAAARLIQKAWRNYTRRQITIEFIQLGLTLDHVRKLSFEDFSAFVGEEKVRSNTAKILRCYGLHDGGGDRFGENAAVRVFLSTYLLLGYPQHVLSHNGEHEQEQDLLTKAKYLLGLFERIVSASSARQNSSPPSRELANLLEAYTTFQTAFSAWKNHDTSVLVETMIAQFVELDAIWQTVKNDTLGGVAEDYNEGIKSNQVLLLARLKRLAGPEQALKLVHDAVQASRKSRSKKRPTGDIKPREASTIPEPSASLPDNTSSQSANLTQAVSSSRNLQLDEFEKLTTPLPDNRTVIHELSINRDYRIDVDLHSDIRNTIARAVFDKMRSDVEAGLGDRWILSMAETIRKKLLRLVTPGKSLHLLISETLDTGMIEKQLRLGNFSYEKFFSFMKSILPKLCAPVRDPEVTALVEDQSDDFIERLAKLMHVIELLMLDYANYLLQTAIPQLLLRAVEYENQAFTAQVGNRKLTKTIRWWSRARTKVVADASRYASETSPPPHPARQPSADKVYTQGLVDLFISLPPLQPSDLPETLELDRDRIERTRTDILRIITISTILLTAKNLLKRDVRAQWKAEAQRMWDLPSAYADATPYLSIIESAHVLPPATRAPLLGTIERVLSDARATPHITQPVMKVLLRKLKTHVIGRIGANSAEERLRSTTNASESIGGSGMAEFVGRIGGLVEEMGKVKGVDWGTHGRWLEDVAGEVGRE